MVDVIGLNDKIMSTTVCNLKPGAAWTISLYVIDSLGAASLEARGTPGHPLNDETVYPLPLYGKYTSGTIAESGGAMDMPANHLLEEIAVILPPQMAPPLAYHWSLPHKDRRESRVGQLRVNCISIQL